MYKIYFNRVNNSYEMSEMVRMFLPSGTFEILNDDPGIECFEEGNITIRVPDEIREKNAGKKYIYETLSLKTGKIPDWGILTGVRPVKLAGEIITSKGSVRKAGMILQSEYLVSNEKTNLLIDIFKLQQKTELKSNKNAVGLYIGIPFCPSRCLYCSFPANSAEPNKIKTYMTALFQEIRYVSSEMERLGLYPDTIYIGGGTPTTLNADELNELLGVIGQSFDMRSVSEYTVEAGRPDTVTESKLARIMENGVDRISINPQSMKQKTLHAIGRNHTPEDIEKAFGLAQAAGIPIINADLIAGLPGESKDDFIYSVEKMINLRPENLTVHTLSVKRASRLKEMDELYSYRQGEEVGAMLDQARKMLASAGYGPYYLYRQKQMAGNFENVGYALPGTENLYNIRIMEENQTIIALGAGGISKVWYPDENRLERTSNVSNYEVYIQRIDEMLQRKKKNIFDEYPT